jgi:hypothetical protein
MVFILVPGTFLGSAATMSLPSAVLLYAATIPVCVRMQAIPSACAYAMPGVLPGFCYAYHMFVAAPSAAFGGIPCR